MSIKNRPSQKRIVVRILNPAPEGADHTSLHNAERFVEKGHAEFIDKTTIRFYRAGERERLQQEEALAYRRRAEIAVDEEIEKTRYGATSWRGHSQRGIPWFERLKIMPVQPGLVRS